MVKTSSKLSKVLSMLIVLSMVLSSMAFTLPVSAAGTVIFYEDFNSTEFNSSTGTVDATVVKGAYLDGTAVSDWAAAANGEADPTTKIIFADEVMQIDKGKYSDGGKHTYVHIATGFADSYSTTVGYDKTGTGYYVFETDFKPISISSKSKWNEYNGEIVVTDTGVTGASNKTIAKISLGTTNGLQDLVGSTTNDTTYTAADANAANGVNYKDNMGTAEGLEGKNIKIR
ncbi:MAG: hypothetical protein J6V58_05915, partial [Clostridia bacterium]|nr:hypothetical protein [Clostridia bacterium]